MNVYDHYYHFSEIEAILERYKTEYPDFVRVTSLCRTEEGRDMLLAEITDTSTGTYEKKPAFYLVGQFHCKEMVGVMCAMYFMEYLLTRKDMDSAVAKMLKDYCICIIPTATPDGLEHALGGGLARSVNKFSPPRTELPNGIHGKDLDGDGVIRFMRIKDPNGPWKKSPVDDRAMIRREPYEFEGEFYSVYREGMVKGDPKICCFDAPDPYGNDFNRSFPYNWNSSNKQPGGGMYPMENVEVRAIVELLTRKTNIGAFLVFHTATGCTFYPPAAFSPDQAPKEDMKRYIDMANIIKEETGFPFCNLNEMSTRDNYPAYGSFDDYAYLVRGVFTYAIELWDMDTRMNTPVIWQRPKNEPNSVLNEREINFFRWMDQNCPDNSFKRWEKFNHPQLGEVEIGGVDILRVQLNPPINLLDEEMTRATRCLMKQIPLLPRVELEDVSCKKRDDGLYQVEATVINKRYFPTSGTKQAEVLHLVMEDFVVLGGENLEFVGCTPRVGTGFLPGMSGVMAMGSAGRYVNAGINRLSKKVSWVIRAEEGTSVTVKAASMRGGHAEVSITLG